MAENGNRTAAFDAMFDANYADVLAYVRRRAPVSSTEDVLADTFLVAWRRLDQVPNDALPWLLAVARRVLANQRRGDRRRGALVTRLTGGWQEQSGGWEPPNELSLELADALASLSSREREALLLVAWEGLESDRAAQVIGCSGAAFRVRLHRARKHVAARLETPIGMKAAKEDLR